MAENEASSEANAASRRWKAIGAVVTFVLALWGRCTGTIAWLKDREVVTDLSAQPFLGPELDQGLIRFSIINRSRHALSISRAAVVLEGRKIGQVEGVVTDLREVGLFATASPDLQRRTQLLPFGIAAESSNVLAAKWNLSENVDHGLDELGEANTFDDDQLPVNRASKTRLELRLRLVPGGERVVRVAVLAGPQPDRDQTGVASGWTVQFTLRHQKIVNMRVGSAYDVLGELTLKIWTLRSANPVLILRRPLGPGVGQFRLASLKRGTYAWALSDGRHEVAVGTFVQPCPSQDSKSPVIDMGSDVNSGSCRPVVR